MAKVDVGDGRKNLRSYAEGIIDYALNRME